MRILRTTAVIAATVMSVVALTAAPSSATGGAAACAGSGLTKCRTAAEQATRTPGKAVASMSAESQSRNGGNNTVISGLPKTKRLGQMDPGVVPTIGSLTARADSGAYVRYETKLTDRVVDLMVYSAAVDGNVPVRVQLPPSWNKEPNRTYPVLYMLHGGNDMSDYQSWSLYTNLLEQTAKTEAIIVMPSGGEDARFTNSWIYGHESRDQWATWIGKELPQILASGYRANGKASIAGVSSAGRGALEAAWLNPGTFGTVASLSSTLDIQPSFEDLKAQVATMGVLPTWVNPNWLSPSTISLLMYKVIPYDVWGNYVRDADVWAAHNPAKNIGRIKASGAKVYVYSSDADPLEKAMSYSAKSFLGAAAREGLPVQLSLPSGATHSWAAWTAELSNALPVLLAGMGL